MYSFWIMISNLSPSVKTSSKTCHFNILVKYLLSQTQNLGNLNFIYHFCIFYDCNWAILLLHTILNGAHSGTVGWGTVLQAGRSQVRFLMVYLGFFTGIILPAALWPCGRLSLCNRNEYQEYFLGGKGSQCLISNWANINFSDTYMRRQYRLLPKWDGTTKVCPFWAIENY
jgi:hypothetical protein